MKDSEALKSKGNKNSDEGYSSFATPKTMAASTYESAGQYTHSHHYSKESESVTLRSHFGGTNQDRGEGRYFELEEDPEALEASLSEADKIDYDSKVERGVDFTTQ